MLKNSTCLIFIFVVNLISTALTEKDVKVRRYPEIDLLLELKQQDWKEDALCYKTIRQMLYGVKNSTLWASWIWDSMQRPTGTLYGSRFQLGNYNECLNPPWKSSHPHLQTQYCLVDVILKNEEPAERSAVLDPYSSTEYYIGTKNNNNRIFNVVTVGVCMPAVCGAQTASALASVLTGLPAHKKNSGAVDCQPNQQHYEWKFYAFIGMIAVVSLLVLYSTLYLKRKENMNGKFNSLVSITLSFCLVTNLKDLTKVNNEEIRILNGMRFITAVITVLMHEMIFLMTSSLNNGLELDEDCQNKFSFMVHIEVVIDTFFAMSGLLHAKGLLANKSQNLLLALMRRYVRLIGPYAVITLFMVTIHETIGSGPLWSRLNRFETDTCSKYWWLNFFMINSDFRTLCYSVSWYISADYQLAILATFIYYIYRRNNKAGYIAFVSAFVLAALIPGVLTYWNRYPAMSFDKVQDMFSARVKEDINQVYIKSYSRAGAYLVGVAMGYIMTSYKPQKYRNVVSKAFSYIGSVIAVGTLCTIMNLGSVFAKRNYDPLETAVWMAFNRSLWAVAICCLISLSEYGSIPYISKFLGWKIFVPLSRLSYGIYIIHPVIIQRKMFSIRSPLKYDIFDILIDVLGVTVLSLFLSLGLYLLVEAPLIKISNKFLSIRPKCVINKNIQNGFDSNNYVAKESSQQEKND